MQEHVSSVCSSKVPLPSGHVLSPTHVSIVNTAYSPPEIDMFLDKGAPDGVKVGDVVYAIDCHGRMKPGTLMKVTSSSRSGATATWKGDASVMRAIKELVVDTSHGATALPATTFGAPSGGKFARLTSAKIPASMTLSPPPVATTDVIMVPGTSGYVVDPRAQKPLATFTVDEATPHGSTLTLRLDRSASLLPETDSQILYYEKSCSFAVDKPDFARSKPAGYTYLSVSKYERVGNKARVTMSRGSDDGILPSSKLYLVKKRAPMSDVTLEIETVTPTSVVVVSSVTDRDTIDGKLLAQVATCT
jgi:hypothetical protein